MYDVSMASKDILRPVWHASMAQNEVFCPVSHARMAKMDVRCPVSPTFMALKDVWYIYGCVTSRVFCLYVLPRGSCQYGSKMFVENTDWSIPFQNNRTLDWQLKSLVLFDLTVRHYTANVYHKYKMKFLRVNSFYIYMQLQKCSTVWLHSL